MTFKLNQKPTSFTNSFAISFPLFLSFKQFTFNKWLDTNLSLLMLEAIVLPTGPQPQLQVYSCLAPFNPN